MSGDRLWVQCCVATIHSHTAPRRPPRGTYLQGAEPRGGGGGPRTGDRDMGKGCYFLAKEIFMALFWVILKPCRASRAAPACTSLSNSTKAMSCRPGTSRTSLKPGNLRDGQRPQESRLSTSPHLSGIPGVGARNVAKHPTMQRTAPITKNYPAPNVYDAKLINPNIKKCAQRKHTI